ncbi:MAG TPA: chloride channel protein [Xanthobacteraceae bacterium]|nr:chloride channel protein [Xanthobacteraceae bacterium]
MTSPVPPSPASRWPLGVESDREVAAVLLLSAVGGAVIALLVAGVHDLVGVLQTGLFGVAVDTADGAGIPAWRRLAVPLLGALVLGLVLVWLERHRRLAIVDPLEANAMEGGRMSGSGTATFVLLSTLSVSIGGSVGFEAAMTQLGAGLLSVAGQRLKLPRRALRCLVACGTSAGIAAMFDAPLTGTLYALELVVGGYAVRALLPTLLAAAVAVLVTHYVVAAAPVFVMSGFGASHAWHYPAGIGIGVAGALIAIVIMRGATLSEALLARSRVPKMLRPAAGGLVLGLLAVLDWQVLGPGHAGLRELIAAPPPGALALAGLLLLKLAASVVCVGSGFRGGLFSASLFIGALFGALVHVAVVVPLAGPSASLALTMAAGMATVCAAVLGTPLAIMLLVLETTGLQIGIVAVALGVVVSVHVTRRLFGYSFSTWKFHVHGQDLSGPRDVGRLRHLTFADAPLTDPLRVAGDARIGATAAALPPGSEIEAPLAVVNPMDVFLGFVRREHLAAAAAVTPDLPVAMIAEAPDAVRVRVDEALAGHIDVAGVAGGWFAVVDAENRLVGFAAEAGVLHRYLAELQAADRDDTALFGARLAGER